MQNHISDKELLSGMYNSLLTLNNKKAHNIKNGQRISIGCSKNMYRWPISTWKGKKDLKIRSVVELGRNTMLSSRGRMFTCVQNGIRLVQKRIAILPLKLMAKTTILFAPT